MKSRRPIRKNAVQLPLDTYLSELNEIPLLDADQEKALAQRVRQGDGEARDQMVLANLRLVVKIARKYCGRGLGLQDLIAEGNLGLLRAVEEFDPSMNTRFSTYAAYWIKLSISNTVIKSGTVPIPVYVNQLLVEWRRAATKLRGELGRTPSYEETARSLNMPRKKLEIVKKALGSSSTTLDDKTGHSIGEALVDEGALAPDEHAVKTEDLKRVIKILNSMKTREATVLRLRFGLEGASPKTLEAIGKTLGMTRERVRQIEKEALNRLSKRMEAG
jgi:RNA polymerase primary sigma factor